MRVQKSVYKKKNKWGNLKLISAKSLGGCHLEYPSSVFGFQASMSADVNLQNKALYFRKCINYSNLSVALINWCIAENKFKFSASVLLATPYRSLFVFSG